MPKELDEWIERELDRLYRYVYTRIHDPYRAEDLTQSIVLHAYASYDRLRDKSRIVPWLWGIAHNVVLQSFRPRYEYPTDDILLIEAAGISCETPESMLMRKYDLSRVRRALASLARQYRDVCVLYYLEELDYQTIAARLGIPLSSVKWRLNQSKKQLKEELTKMEYMENGYRRASALKLDMGGYVGNWDPQKGCYDGADSALNESLLAQNICCDAYAAPKTVSALASDLGVAADYIEFELERLTRTQCVRQTGNRYQTAFPILSRAVLEELFEGNYAMMEAAGGDICDCIFSLAPEAAKIGFAGSEKPVERLMLCYIGLLCRETKVIEFKIDQLPFASGDCSWFILATDEAFPEREGNGINTCGYQNMTEFYFYQEEVPDRRFNTNPLRQAIKSLLCGETVWDDLLAQLVETGKVALENGVYRVTTPVLDERTEYPRLMEVFAPALEKIKAVQQTVLARSCEVVQRVLPEHLASQREFFGHFFALNALDTALFCEMRRRGVPLAPDTVYWFTTHFD